MNNLPVAREGISYILFSAILCISSYFVYLPLAVIFFVFFLFTLYFFRDPSRTIPQEENTIVSPADGRIISVTPLFDSTFIGNDAYKISIFLSLFNVHVNRSPIQGVVIDKVYREGNFFPAFKSHASELNERNTLYIEGKGINVIVHQITGFIARRIVCRIKKGDTLEKGERFGIIKFGSCTEVIVPGNVEVIVRVGDKVRGGKTVIGVKKDGV